MYNYNKRCLDSGDTTCPEPEEEWETIYVDSVRVYPKSISLDLGKWSYSAYAVVCPEYANITDVRWHSSNSSVASVNASLLWDSVSTLHFEKRVRSYSPHWLEVPVKDRRVSHSQS